MQRSKSDLIDLISFIELTLRNLSPSCVVLYHYNKGAKIKHYLKLKSHRSKNPGQVLPLSRLNVTHIS